MAQKTTKTITLDFDFAQALLNYLVSKPYVEVYQLVAVLGDAGQRPTITVTDDAPPAKPEEKPTEAEKAALDAITEGPTAAFQKV